MTKPQMPNTFTIANTHRVVLFQPDTAPTDMERIEDLLADGFGLAREALDLMQHLPSDLVLPLQAAERALRQEVVRRHMLAETTRAAMSRWLRDADRLVCTGCQHSLMPQIQRKLTEAIGISDRVLDLLAAERAIKRHRNIEY